jgi:deglycase
LREEGMEVQIAAPERKVLNSVIHDFEPGWDTYVEKPGYRIPADIAFRDVQPENFDGLILSGGRAPEYLRNNPDLVRIVRHFAEKTKPLAALCHGSLILAAAGVLNGKKIATYEALAPDMEKAGAEFLNWEVVVDGNLISSRTWMDLPFFMREFLKTLRSSQTTPVGARA